MLIIHELNLIYVRVPKTASTSFVNALDDLGPESFGAVHENAQGIANLLRQRPELAEYRKVGFIRHPYQWIRSAYAHWMVNPDMFRVRKPQTIHTFAGMLPKTPAQWLMDEHGKVICDAWRAEDLEQIMTGLGLETHRKNVRFQEPYEPDDKLKAIVREKFALDFELGGYEA